METLELFYPRITAQAGALAAIALPFGDLTPVIIGEVVL